MNLPMYYGHRPLMSIYPLRRGQRIDKPSSDVHIPGFERSVYNESLMRTLLTLNPILRKLRNVRIMVDILSNPPMLDL